MALTTKELMLLEDNIKITQNGVKFMESCGKIASDPQIKGLCQQMVREHQSDLQTLMKHINASTMQ